MTVARGRPTLEPRAFAGRPEFRAWLERNHASATELLIRLSKVGAGGGLTYREALDEALCHGWIDGVRRRLDATSFSQRFSPRKPKSAWSTVNIKRFRELDAEGRVRPAGRKAFEAGVKSHYSFESKPTALSPALLRAFRAKPNAWRFFSTTPPWYQRTCSFYVMSAKQPETRERRLANLISHSERGESLAPLKLPKTRAAVRGKAGRRR
jgi:uncharacterized protein YdeI (YjbR/CyaY-like superfamily)